MGVRIRGHSDTAFSPFVMARLVRAACRGTVLA